MSSIYGTDDHLLEDPEANEERLREEFEAMDTLKRYTIDYEYGGTCTYEDSDGDWCRDSDVKDLESKLQRESEWVSVDDRLPKFGKPVLGCFKHWNTSTKYYQTIVRVSEDDCTWKIWDIEYMDEISHDYNVTHWKPITPPEWEG